MAIEEGDHHLKANVAPKDIPFLYGILEFNQMQIPLKATEWNSSSGHRVPQHQCGAQQLDLIYPANVH